MEQKGSVLMHKYEIGKVLGQGTFAKVYHGRNLATGTNVAVKVVDKEKVFKVGMMEQIKREISVMGLVRHPNVVELYEVLATKSKIYFVMEYVRGGELFNKVAKGRLKEDVARKYFQQLVSAVDFCHSRGVCHRDLKPENLLLDESGNLKVSDFGLSALAESKRQDGLLHTTCGTPAYVAPEVIIRKGYDGAKADIWSCGVILYVLLAGYLPFQESNLMDMYRKIGKGEFKFPSWFAPEVRKLLLKILDPNPNNRISMAKIMENSWFSKGLQPIIVNESETNSRLVHPMNQAEAKPCNLNAFDIISHSMGFDLSGLFEERECKKEVRFTSKKPASAIVAELVKIAKKLNMKVVKQDGGVLKLDGPKVGRKGILGIETEIFEVTPLFHLVEMKKTGGDTLEYEAVLKQEIKPALKDVVWTWQGETQQHPREDEQQCELLL